MSDGECKGCCYCIIGKILGLLVIIGALNWGLVGAFGYNLVDHIFGVGSLAARVVYSIVGLSGLGLLVKYFTHPNCHCCNKECKR